MSTTIQRETIQHEGLQLNQTVLAEYEIFDSDVRTLRYGKIVEIHPKSNPFHPERGMAVGYRLTMQIKTPAAITGPFVTASHLITHELTAETKTLEAAVDAAKAFIDEHSKTK